MNLSNWNNIFYVSFDHIWYKSDFDGGVPDSIHLIQDQFGCLAFDIVSWFLAGQY